ncbi:MAG: redoxin domain-containing protein [Clostridiales bacterium]|nr:redoxin domain-containing protein [Clostridiales bacterium]
MILNIISGQEISYMLVFIEGLLSFFSPCILPLLPVYMSYLAGNAREDEGGIIKYERKKVFLHTIFFVLGISFAFFVLLTAFTSVGSFFNSYKNLFTRIGGIIIIILGLFQLGVFELKFLQRERRFTSRLIEREVNPIIAFVMGFTFSFAWTPCIGPMLSSVLIFASSAKTAAIGNMLILLYTLGFTIPFLILGLFTTKILDFLNKKRKILKYTIKAGGIILIIIGVMTYTGWMNGVSSYLNSITNDLIYSNDSGNKDIDETESQESPEDTDGDIESVPSKESQEAHEEEIDVIPAIDFTLTDQYGNEHTLSDYKGKAVFLNFWATWCPPCREEMPDIEKLYKEFNLNQDEVVILGVAGPRTDMNPNTREVTKDEVIDFINENEYTFPTLFDETGEIFYYYFIQSLPTTFLIDKEGNIFGYHPGMMTESIMRRAIEDTIASTK